MARSRLYLYPLCLQCRWPWKSFAQRTYLLRFSAFLLCFILHPFCVTSGFSLSPLWFPLCYLTCPFPLLSQVTCPGSPRWCSCVFSHCSPCRPCLFVPSSVSLCSSLRHVLYCLLQSLLLCLPWWYVSYFCVWFSLLICTLLLVVLCFSLSCYFVWSWWLHFGFCTISAFED